MTPAEIDSPLLKSDTRGRVFTPRAWREQWLGGFERSGHSGAKFPALVANNF